MKYVQTIWQTNPAQAAVHQGSWMGSLIATMETKFPISFSLVVLPEHRQQVLTWLAAKAFGSYTVEELLDGRVVVAFEVDPRNETGGYVRVLLPYAA